MRRALVVATGAVLMTACAGPVNAGPPAASTSSRACHIGADNRPDPICTPGAFNTDVSQATIGSTICVRGWTATVRPPVSYTSALKRRQIAAYGYTDTNPAHYEEDHLVPLELGGAPRDPRNLWPEPHAAQNKRGSLTKDAEENALRARVCNGSMYLQAARAKILADWGPPTR